jgi:tetratricopeptide (TPR) repeat protein
LGEALQETGHLDEAIASFRKATQLSPQFGFAHLSLGRALDQQGHLEEAIASLRKAVGLMPRNALAQTLLGTALSQKNEEEAIVCFRCALAVQPENETAMLGLGMALMHTGNLLESIATFQHLEKVLPASHFTLPLVRKQLSKAKQWRKMEEDWPAIRKAENLPQNASECLDLAKMANFKKEYDFAVRCYRAAFALEKKLFVANHYIAACCALRAAAMPRSASAKGGPDQQAEFRNQSLEWLQTALAGFLNFSRPRKSLITR